MSRDSQPANDSPVTLINVFEVPTEHVDVFIAQWRERAAPMSTARLTLPLTSIPPNGPPGQGRRRRRWCGAGWCLES
jgi:hypothetical protein